MTAASFFDDCQILIERGHESWKSYFSKWEAFAKYEESVPESELFIKSNNKIKSAKKLNVKRQTQQKSKTLSLFTLRKKQRNKKKYHKKSSILLKTETDQKIEECRNSNIENLKESTRDDEMETILKSVFINILKANKNNLEVFNVLSQTFSNTERTVSHNLLLNCQQTLPLNNFQLDELSHLISNRFPSTISEENIYDKFIHVSRSVCIHNPKSSLNLFELGDESVIKKRKFERTKNLSLDSSSNRIKFIYKKMNQTSEETAQRKFGLKSCHLASLSSPKFEVVDFKSHEMVFNHKSHTSIFRKINREYFIKKTFPKVSIALDEKRIRKLCLHKRTNSVSLSMENSNFITPERKPSEWKCFSENVLQRKRKCPSKLFFDNEEEDSESDDQTENRAPLIYCKNKLKTKIKPEVVESDSDDCENIFDRIKKP